MAKIDRAENPELIGLLADGEKHPLQNPNHKFKDDRRTENKGLHMLYFTTALEHLRAIDLAIMKFSDFANLNMHGCMDALYKERKKLVWENAAYAEADVMLRKLKLTLGNLIVDAETGDRRTWLRAIATLQLIQRQKEQAMRNHHISFKYYLAFSIHGTNSFRVVTKEAPSLHDLGPGFTVVPSRRPGYNVQADGIKVHWNKLCRADGKPLQDKGWVTRRFKELVAQGWIEVQPKGNNSKINQTCWYLKCTEMHIDGREFEGGFLLFRTYEAAADWRVRHSGQPWTHGCRDYYSTPISARCTDAFFDKIVDDGVNYGRWIPDILQLAKDLIE